MKAKKTVIAITFGMLLTMAVLGAMSFVSYSKGAREFVADGYILKPSEEVNVTTQVNEQYYFSQGDKYREKFETKVLFKDASNQDVMIDTEEFVHYADGSLGTFTKGVVMKLDDLEEEQFGYYSLTKNTILVKNGSSYEMTSRGEQMTLNEFVWKISDTDYMLVSPEVTLRLGTDSEVTLPDYAQIKYVDNGIVRIVHQQGTYQTVSADTTLLTQGGAELNLVSKNFYVNGEPGLSLDSMAIDDDSYIEVDENTETPGLQLPTFNVINGKDGASGEDGEDGESGEDGEDGEEGEQGNEGSEGSEGAAGTEGGAGAAGANGTDGVEGDSGIMGYDGKDGEDGQRDDQTGIVAADLNARPTVTMENESYDVTPGSVQMQLNLSDKDQALSQGDTEVMLYDRATMEALLTKEEAQKLGQNLETSGSIAFNNNKLAPGTEYLVVVSGKYASEKDGGTLYEANLFTKIFKTDELGIVLEKGVVTDSSINLETTVSSTAIGNYNVVLYQYDENGNKVDIGTYTSVSGSRDDLLFDYAATKPDTISKELKSNTVYYAALASVNLANTSQMLETAGTEIKIKTLKKKPYHLADDGSTTPITEMKPMLAANDKSHTLTLTLDAVTDMDKGIQKYRYELYKSDEVQDDTTLSTLTPAYTAESDELQTQTFNISADDTSGYIARVVAVFDDNEKTVEYSTLLSDIANLTSSTFPVAQLVEVNKKAPDGGHHDVLSGYVMIKDTGNMLVPHISTTYPLVVTLSCEFETEVFTLKLDDLDVLTPATGADLGATYYYFEKDNLRKNTTYSISVSGPVDVDGSGTIDSTEARTYLTGGPAATTQTYGLRAVFSEVPVATAAFSMRLNFTAGAETVQTGEGDAAQTLSISDDFYRYETDTMEAVTLELVHVLEDGTQKIMGDPYTIVDTNPNTHDSIFFDGGWVDRTAVKDGEGGYLTPVSADLVNTRSNELVLTPKNFGLDNNDSVFYTGGKFIIRVKQATDYTDIHKNVIPFIDGKDGVIFEIQKKHIQAANPSNQVRVATITNGSDSARNDNQHQAELYDDTVVGLLIQANYEFHDAKEITYQVWRLADDEASPDADENSKDVYPKDAPAADVATKGGVQVGELVCEYTVSGLQGDVGDGNADPIKLYFKDLAMVSDAVGNGTWTNKTSETDISKVMARGGRYFVTYKTRCSEDSIYGYACDHTIDQHYYPACAYASGEVVPYYRSRVLEIQKQMPKVERYPLTSGDSSATWKYKIADPDGAITTDASGNANFEVLTKDAYDAATGSSASQFVNVAAYANYADLQLTGLVEGKYYAVNIPYKLMTVDSTAQKITSMPVLFKKPTSNAGQIELCGQKLSGTDTGKVNIHYDQYEDALINQGGYQYRLTVRGNDVTKLAALRVTFTGQNNAGEAKTVVYDPVYLDVQQSTTMDDTTEYPYAYAYMDSSALQGMVGTATVTVKGYYSTNVTGVADYKPTQTIGGSKQNLEGESVYALRMLNANGDGSYVYQESNSFIQSPTRLGDTTSAVKSLFIPGADNDAQTGFDEDNKTLSQRYASTPLVLLTDNFTSSKTLNLTFDENGMMDNDSSKYVMMERLDICDINFKNGDYRVSLSDILPAVQRVNTSAGVNSLLMNMEIKGTGAHDSSKIYAQILENVDGIYKTLKVTVEEQDRVDENGNPVKVKVYKVDESDRHVETAEEDSYFAIGNYGTDNIAIKPEDGKFIYPLRIQGLKQNTEYNIIMFAYDNAGNRQDLYSIDGKQIGYRYSVKTKNTLNIQTDGPVFKYDTYATKSASFGFAVPGDEGTGMIASYWVEDLNGTKVISEKTLPRLGTSGYQYYSTDISRNNRMSLAMNPGGALKLNTDYILKVKVVSEVGGEILGEKDVEFRTPSSLEKPGFMVQATPKTVGDKSTLTVRVVCTDKNFAVMGDNYTVTVKNESGTVVAEKTQSKSGQSAVSTNLITFDNLEQNVIYTIEVKANADLDNDPATAPLEVMKSITVTTVLSTSATIDTDATADDLTLYLSRLVNFGSVEQVLITAYKEGTLCFNSTLPISSFSGSGDSRSISLNWSEGSWGTKESGTYEIQLQYRDASGNVLGDDYATARVKGGVAAAMFSIRRPGTNAVESSTQEIETTETESTETESTETESTETVKETEVQESVEMETPQIESEDVDTIEEGGDSELSPASNQEVVQE